MSDITIHMPQRTSRILLVRITANKNASIVLIRVTSFAQLTVWFGVTRRNQNTVNDYFTKSRSMITIQNLLLHSASQSAMNTVHFLTRIRFALVLQKTHFTLDDEIYICGICIVMEMMSLGYWMHLSLFSQTGIVELLTYKDMEECPIWYA